MATKLLLVTLRPGRCYLTKQMALQTRLQFTHWSKNPQNIFVSQIPHIQMLHHKVYDKEAGLDTQREFNRHHIQEEQEINESQQFNEKELFFKKNSIKNRKEKLQIPRKQNFESIKVKKSNDELQTLADADTFGNATITEQAEDAGDLEEEAHKPKRRLTRETKKIKTKEYAFQIKELMNAKRLKDAIEVLELKMKEDGVRPENYLFNLLISGCAKAGYTRKAFSLYNEMVRRGLKVTGGTITSLFNACANAPSSKDGLSHAQKLRETMLEKGIEPNAKTYNVMIKAYGRCGDLRTAYMFVDEMLEKKLPLQTDTFNFLLQACASDKEYGFRHCLLTWHKMLKCGLTPDYYTFHTVLRCVRDCGFGDLQTMHEVLNKIIDERQNLFITEGPEQLQIESQYKVETSDDANVSTIDEIKKQKSINPDSNETATSTLTTIKQSIKEDEPMLDVPNLLARRAHLGSLVSLTEVNKPHERLLLLGGMLGYLNLMKQHNITPNIQTFTTMLEVIPPTNVAEKLLLKMIRKIGLKADIDFFNILIKKRSMRFDYESAKEVLTMIQTAGLYPDIVTYGVLALGCQTEEQARELLLHMRDHDIRMNIEILGAMLRQGCALSEFPYVRSILQISLDEGIKPNDVFLTHLHNFYNRCARKIDAQRPFTKKKYYKCQHLEFCDKLRLYYEEWGIAGLKLEDAIKKIKERPYAQYKEENVNGMEPLKNEKLARKQKLRKYIKKIKIANLRDDDPSFDTSGQRGWKPKELTTT